MANAHLCLVASVLILATVAPSSGMNQACKNLNKCKGPSVKAIKDDNIEEICPPIEKQMECMLKNTEECDVALIATAFRESLAILNKTYTRHCVLGLEADTGAALDQAGACSNLTQCFPASLLKNLEGNMKKVCGDLTMVLGCYDANKDSCDVMAVKGKISKLVQNLKSHLDNKCNGSGHLNASLTMILLSFLAAAKHLLS